MLRSALVRCDERQIDVRVQGRRQLDLRSLRSLTQTLQSQLVLTQIDSLRFLELIDEILCDDVVHILAPKRCITVRRLNLEDASRNL
mmetsp:Transcript_56779/g.124516  ORF Transcript_56779/g.124516 Transcript_56779/m.124516 type:complete len:87 (-) Transcript_56779:761-1021(-)